MHSSVGLRILGGIAFMAGLSVQAAAFPDPTAGPGMLGVASGVEQLAGQATERVRLKRCGRDAEPVAATLRLDESSAWTLTLADVVPGGTTLGGSYANKGRRHPKAELELDAAGLAALTARASALVTRLCGAETGADGLEVRMFRLVRGRKAASLKLVARFTATTGKRGRLDVRGKGTIESVPATTTSTSSTSSTTSIPPPAACGGTWSGTATFSTGLTFEVSGTSVAGTAFGTAVGDLSLTGTVQPDGTVDLSGPFVSATGKLDCCVHEGEGTSAVSGLGDGVWSVLQTCVGACVCDVPGTGCADGEREGFTDVGFGEPPDIAGCSGGWDQPGIVTPQRTGCAVAGDDSANGMGIGCGAADLCGVGWHVCTTPSEVAALTLDLGCQPLLLDAGGPAFFAQRQSGEGGGRCEATGANDIFGCGTTGGSPDATCAPLDRSSGDLCSAIQELGWVCGSDGLNEANNAIKTSPGGGGVLCCRNGRVGAPGCADGHREGFLNVATHPDIAGCGGGWDVAGTLYPVSTGCGEAGDDSANPTGTGCGAEDLCAAGWHVCTTPAEVAANSADGCGTATRAGDPALFFVQRESGQGSGACGAGANDLFGCGNTGGSSSGTCTPLDRFSGDGCGLLPTGGWSCGAAPSTTEALDVVKTGADGGGVLCCRGPAPPLPSTCTDGDFFCPAGCGKGTDDDCPSCFVDLGQTVRDTCTNLEWEKKTTAVGSGVNAVDLHDVDNVYSWMGCCDGVCFPGGPPAFCQPNAAAAAACNAQADPLFPSECEVCASGTCDVDPYHWGAITTVWDWLNQVNAANFAGHDDWRLPSEVGCNTCWTGNSCTSCSPHELETILLSPYPCATSPCIDSIFGPTSLNYYQTSSPDFRLSGFTPGAAWCVEFGLGKVHHIAQNYGMSVRAVRGAP